MSGYIEAGYAVVLGGLTVYGTLLVARERSARRRLPEALWRRRPASHGAEPAAGSPGDGTGPTEP